MAHDALSNVMLSRDALIQEAVELRRAVDSAKTFDKKELLQIVHLADARAASIHPSFFGRRLIHLLELPRRFETDDRDLASWEELKRDLHTGILEVLLDDVGPTVKAQEVPRNAFSPLAERRVTELLVMRGGGVKGLAFAGALEVLEREYSFKVFAGTSAGAITATFLAAGLTAKTLQEILRETDFRKFLDAPMPMTWLNLLFRGGLYPGQALKEWVERVLRSRETLRTGILELNRLPFRAILFAADHISGTIASIRGVLTTKYLLQTLFDTACRSLSSFARYSSLADASTTEE